MNRLYNELAEWWPLLSPPEDYADEAEYFLPLMAEHSARPQSTLLELGSGGGSNAFHMKHAFHSVTLCDIAPHMLEVSYRLNPDCEHLPGDMRTVRLGRTFDVVFIHDAIDYMTTLEDLKAAIQTAFTHCNAGALVVFVPDHTRETFEPYTDHGGIDGDGRAMRYLEWTYDPDPADTTCVSEFVLVLREGNNRSTVEHDRHIFGLFPRDQWLSLMREVGFVGIEYFTDPFERNVFVGRAPSV